MSRSDFDPSALRIDPMGDQAIFIACPDENSGAAISERIRSTGLSWVVDVVQAYRSVAVFFEARAIDFAKAVSLLRDQQCLVGTRAKSLMPRRHTIPCCYELGLDFERIEQFTKFDRTEIIRLHSGIVYTVYAIGFCPGFPYLGYLPEALANVPRLDTPRLKVNAGSVGLTGRQTGIYTEERPGGWNILGRTPYTLVDVADGFFPLKTGDEVVFRPIPRKEYEELVGQRLPTTSSESSGF